MRGLSIRGAVMLAGASLLAAATLAGGAGVASAATGTLTGIEAPLPANASANPGAVVVSVSCASAGDCTAVGGYNDTSGATQGLLLTQASGRWATGVQAPLPASAAADAEPSLNAVTCTSAGNCTAVGNYYDRSGQSEGLLLTQVSGQWSAAEAPVPAGTAADTFYGAASVSCTSPGNCAAAGNYTTVSGQLEGQLLTETSGHWTTEQAPLPAGAAAEP